MTFNEIIIKGNLKDLIKIESKLIELDFKNILNPHKTVIKGFINCICIYSNFNFEYHLKLEESLSNDCRKVFNATQINEIINYIEKEKMKK